MATYKNNVNDMTESTWDSTGLADALDELELDYLQDKSTAGKSTGTTTVTATTASATRTSSSRAPGSSYITSDEIEAYRKFIYVHEEQEHHPLRAHEQLRDQCDIPLDITCNSPYANPNTSNNSNSDVPPPCREITVVMPHQTPKAKKPEPKQQRSNCASESNSTPTPVSGTPKANPRRERRQSYRQQYLSKQQSQPADQVKPSKMLPSTKTATTRTITSKDNLVVQRTEMRGNVQIVYVTRSDTIYEEDHDSENDNDNDTNSKAPSRKRNGVSKFLQNSWKKATSSSSSTSGSLKQGQRISSKNAYVIDLNELH